MVEKDNMKKIIIATMVLFGLGFMGGVANSSDFALIDLKAPITSVGSFVDAGNGSSAAGGLVAIVTHKQKGLGVLDSLINGWTPITAGGTLGAGLGGPSIAIGTGVNLFPAAQATLYSLVNSVAKDDQLTGLKVALAPSATAASIFIGPQESLIFKSTSHYGTRLTFFVGASITWK